MSSASRVAVASHTSALRELMYTLAPLVRKPPAIISPIPREPPVTRTIFPATEKRFSIERSFIRCFLLWSYGRRHALREHLDSPASHLSRLTTVDTTVDVKRELVDLSDYVWGRTRSRLDGVTDEEYFWEPAPGCWTVRQRDDGTWMADGPLPRPEPEPFTTIAWRLWHLIDMYGEDRAPKWLDVPARGSPIGRDDPEGAPPATAADAITLLERAHERWDAHLDLTENERLEEMIGPVAGPEYAERTRAAYVLHMLDEFIHHGAEIALLRDLWRWQHPVRR